MADLLPGDEQGDVGGVSTSENSRERKWRERLEDPKHLAVDGRVGLLVAPPCHLEGPAGVGASHRVSSSAGQAADCSGETSLFALDYVPIS